MNVISKKREVFDQLEFKGPIREVISKIITIENPTTVPATFNQADHKLPANQLIWMNLGTFNIAPGKSIGLQINYRPLNISSVDDKLVLVSKELGEFSYSLKLSGVANENVRTVLFKTEIGQSTITPIKLQSFLTRPVTYQLKIINHEGDNFYLENGTLAGTSAVQQATVDKGIDFTLPIKFDPSIIGECKASVEISDKDIGSFFVRLRGISDNPQPKGPIYIPSGKSTVYEWRNPFAKQIEINIRVDSPSFTLDKVKGDLKVDPKKATPISILFKQVENSINGKLIISAKGYQPWIV